MTCRGLAHTSTRHTHTPHPTRGRDSFLTRLVPEKGRISHAESDYKIALGHPRGSSPHTDRDLTSFRCSPSRGEDDGFQGSRRLRLVCRVNLTGQRTALWRYFLLNNNPRYPTRPKDIHLENLEKAVKAIEGASLAYATYGDFHSPARCRLRVEPPPARLSAARIQPQPQPAGAAPYDRGSLDGSDSPRISP